MNKGFQRSLRTGLMWLSLILLCSSCGSLDKLGLKTGDKQSDFFEHIVQWPEENLYNITVWHTGTLEKYSEVRNANPRLSPYSLSIGDKVQIPQSIVTNREPMPKINDKATRVSQKPLAIQPPGRTFYSHRVSITGESLSIIAKWYTGDLKNWEQLATANPNLNPNRIDIGDEILIPEDMMIRKDHITKSFVDSFAPRPKEKAVVSAPEPEPASPPPPVPAVEESEIELVPPKF